MYVAKRYLLPPMMNSRRRAEVLRTADCGHYSDGWTAGQTFHAWARNFTDAEIARIKDALHTWDSYGAAADRHWLEPLLMNILCSTPSAPEA